MPNRFFYKFLSFILLFFGFVTIGFSQEFTKSAGMVLFNRAEYDSAITAIERWINENPQEQGIARYYLGEAHYNLGMSTSSLQLAKVHFRSADQAFERTLTDPALKSLNAKIYFSAQLKRGWCAFRRAEIGEQTEKFLDRAFANFIQIDSEAPDSLIMQAHIMAGESRFRKGILQKYAAFSSSLTKLNVNQVISTFNESSTYFNRALHQSSAGFKLQFFAQIRKNDLLYEIGKIYQNLPPEIFNNLLDENKKATASETALSYFSQVNYRGVNSQSLTDPVYGEFLRYSDAMKWLNRFFISANYEDKRQFLNSIHEVKLAELDAEKKFRMGNADQNTSQIDNNANFFNLYQNDARSYYFQVLDAVPESYFWLGTVQFVANQKTGIDNLNTFIQQYSSRSNEPRISMLLDYAKYWRGMLYLEEYRNNRNRLADLKSFLQEFHPQSQNLDLQRDLLHKLTQLELGEDIWKEVLKGENTPNWFQEAVQIIQYLLRRAATVVGENRLHYLQQLNRIFYYTNYQKSNETAFYEGISKSLEAEIQGDEDDKKDMFKESAEILASVKGTYQAEADYIRGRSLFFAEKYDDAKKIFKQLINEKRSLRSLYYFAEILRQKGYGNVAKLCYEVIKEKTQANPDGRFWYANADAAINLCVNRADGSGELNGVNYQNVIFPDVLLDTVSNSYEQLADRKYVRFQYLQQSLDLMKKYVLPKKTIYIANKAPAGSIFRENTMESVPAFFDEMLKRETSVLDIFVVAPTPAGAPVEVRLNDGALHRVSDGHFRSSTLNVGDRVRLSISDRNFYGYQHDVNVSSPGQQQIIIPLTEKVEYQKETSTNGAVLHPVSFPNRLDCNMIIQKNDLQIPQNSRLMSDLSKLLDLRDVVFHPQLNRFLVVDRRLGQALLQYDENGEKTENEPVFQLQFTDSDLEKLIEPEGIAVDHNGNIYISDFASHHIVIFDRQGRYQFYFGSYGKNDEVNDDEQAHFVFPTRLAIEEDQTGVETDINGENERVFRTPFILVADRFGVHRCDMEGRYIETIIKPDGARLSTGEIYALGIRDYGIKANVYLGVRKENGVITYIAKPIR